MLDNLMGNMDEHQKAIDSKLKSIEIIENIEGVQIKSNAAGQILNVSISEELLKDKEQLEDLLTVGFSNLLAKIKTEEATASQEALKSILPPGMEGLFGQ